MFNSFNWHCSVQCKEILVRAWLLFSEKLINGFKTTRVSDSSSSLGLQFSVAAYLKLPHSPNFLGLIGGCDVENMSYY